MNPHKPLDRNGRVIRVGDVVRIVGVPDLSGMSQAAKAESVPVFQYLVGKYKRIRGFDEFGCAELSFVMRHAGDKRRWHSVWVEPFLLHIPQRRSNPAAKRDTPKAARPLPKALNDSCSDFWPAPLGRDDSSASGSLGEAKLLRRLSGGEREEVPIESIPREALARTAFDCPIIRAS